MDLSKIKYNFLQSNATKKLIYINVAMFLVVAILNIVWKLAGIYGDDFALFLQLPSSVEVLKNQWWSVLSYMFLHTGLWHLFFNMLCLYWFGQIFLMHFREKQLIGLYLLGGVLGGVVYMVSYAIFPYFRGQTAWLCGASASIFALIVASALQSPNMPIRFFLIGEIKLKWIALISVIISVLGINNDNAGGEIAHIGGAIGGLVWFALHSKGLDLTQPIDSVMVFFSNLWCRVFGGTKTMKVKRPNQQYHYVKPDEEYNQERKHNSQRLDEILDKIRKSGYSSLSEQEKKELFEVSNKV